MMFSLDTCAAVEHDLQPQPVLQRKLCMRSRGCDLLASELSEGRERRLGGALEAARQYRHGARCGLGSGRAGERNGARKRTAESKHCVVLCRFWSLKLAFGKACVSQD